MSEPRFQADIACAFCRDDRDPKLVKLAVVRSTALLDSMPATTTVALVKHMGRSDRARVAIGATGLRLNRSLETRDRLVTIPTPAAGQPVEVRCRGCNTKRQLRLENVVDRASRLALERRDFYVTVYI